MDEAREKSMDPVISSRYGMRPLLDLPALDLASGNDATKPYHLDTMAPSDSCGYPYEGAGYHPFAPRLSMPTDWPYAARLPGSLFAAPPGPMPFKNPQMFPYNFVHRSPFTMQPPPFQIIDSSGQPVPTVGSSSFSERQILSQLYPGVHDPCPPHGYNALFPPTGLAWPSPRQNPAGNSQAVDAERVHFRGMLTYGELSAEHGQNKSNVFWSLPKFLRQELHQTYRHVPITDVRIVERNGEFQVFASPRGTDGDRTNNEAGFDQRLVVD